METRCSKVSFQTIQKRNRLKILSYRRYREHGKKCLFFWDYLFTLLCAAELALSRWKLSTPWSRTAHKLPAASYALLPNLKKIYFLPSERDRDRGIFVACFLHSSAQMCLYQTPGRRPPRITGRCELWRFMWRFKGKRLEIAVKSAGKGSRPPWSESDGDRTPTINFCDGLKATN